MKFTSRDVSALLADVEGTQDLVGHACGSSIMNGFAFTWNGTNWQGTYHPQLQMPKGEDSVSC
ncbi:hypothetical protein D7Y13_22725 [Corallococcus praedator]|uniref:Uncharacterized protein n=1 Tax=Corallococcus praedator TaxID=2316724 RepID=A0ABX9QGM6_9BACT|nr:MULTISPECIES: hypothetical protein [Corallococcus]RKH17074.1 hypothetical protein D7X74_13585 [Corallococcus sp. CA047B]RKH32225.1 hypothetical protein D7X75_16550 [Corallococcus sp. CA031C]RKI03175.1 hypothetical protein D7Y13_22725 [Corallococcus praedator]